MTTTYFVTGVTGTVGHQVAVELLHHEDARVRVGARDVQAPKARALAELGAEVVPFDYENRAAVREALSGVHRAVFVPPLVENLDQLVSGAVAEAAAAGVSHIVRVSAHGADPNAPFALARWHGNADVEVAESGVSYTILQPTFFQDNVLNIHGESLRSQGAFYGASGGARVAYISSADIARTAAAVLRDPSSHAGKTYLLTGKEAVTDAEVAGLLTEITGKQISYVDLPPDELGAGVRDSGAPAWLADALVALEGVKAQGWASEPSPAVAEITGKPPESYRSFLARTASSLG